MNVDSIADFTSVLRSSRLLEPVQWEQLTREPRERFAEPRTLARELVRRGWLTPFQVNALFQGRSGELLLGSYVLLEKLGEGGMGAVFKARNWKTGRIVALKLIRKERLTSPDTIRRFQREIRAAAQLDHPNLVHALDADEVGGTHLLVMEYVAGTDLARLLKQHGPLPVAAACECIRQAALGLQAAHERGLVHRDLKPANLLLTAPGNVVKVLDMGLARLESSTEVGESTSTLTAEGTVMGTPDYIAPEQARDAHTADIRADLYSLGCTLYHLLTGQVPFPGGTLTEKLLRHQLDVPRPVQQLRAEVPAALVQVVDRLLAKRPEERYQTPAELARALEGLAGVGDNPAGPAAPASQATASPWASLATRPPQVIAPRKPAAPTRRWLLAPVSGLVAVVLLVLLLRPFGRPGSESRSPGPVTDSAASRPKPPQKYVTNSIGMKFVRIEPGTFLMGSPDGTTPAGVPAEEGRLSNETPHRVTLTKGYYLGVHLVTQHQWEQVMGKDANHSGFKGNDEAEKKKLPVDGVSWFDCVEFCIKLSEKEKRKPHYRLTSVIRNGDGVQAAKVELRAEGTGYRLPTEAEWEYACRAGTGTAFWWGNAITHQKANYGPKEGKTTPVDRFPANPWGLHDMHGNLYQWCQDWYHVDYYAESDDKDPKGPDSGACRVLRGGSWLRSRSWCRAARRGWDAPAQRVSEHGCRLLLHLD